jgi:cytochrome c553
MLGVSFWAVCACAQASTPLEALKMIQSDPVALKAAVEAGRKATSFCANCHGEDGVSKSPDVPNLAGQNPAYLLEQIRKFGTGERKDPFMQGLIKVLKEEERRHIALYFASNPVPPSRADAALAVRGKALFDKLCVRCHGDQARGSDLYPRLAGQKMAYLQTSIIRYRDGNGIRSNPLMNIATSTLGKEDIVAISHYLTQLP